MPLRFPFFTVFVLISALLLYSCERERGKEEEGLTVFRYNEAANITSLDPAFARDQPVIWATNQLFNGLVQLNDKLEIHPCIANSWEISADGLEYVFHLRNDVRFHDSKAFPSGMGRKVTASDFVYSFSRIVDPSVASPGAWVFNYVDHPDGNYHFEALNDSTFRVRLMRPYPPFLGLLTTQYCSVVPREAVTFFGNDFRSNPVGTGPFCFRMWKEGVKLVFLKNPRYFEMENGKRLPFLDAVAITFLSDKQSAFLEFMKGNIDLMSGIDPSYKDELLTRQGELKSRMNKRFVLVTGPYLNTEYLGFLDDQAFAGVKDGARARKIRQAFNFSFDRVKMIRYLRNNIGTAGLNGIIPKGMRSFDSTTVYYEYNPALASRLLAEAGFPAGAGLPPITLSSTSDYLDLCKYIQYQVGQVGIDLKIDVVPPAALKEMKAQAKVPFFRASWIADYPDAENYLSLFCSWNFSPKGPNYTHFSNAAYDSLYEQSMVTVNDTIRFGLYRSMEHLMMDEAPVVILYYDRVLRFVSRKIHGLGCDPMNLLTLKRVRKE